ncbi:MAG TPA: hypothetical protein VM890_07650 [Longimicrobium sp.]|nr:hypothetical protein [Longimicrobium sp.]
MTDLPFRWNVARREQLGSLVEGPPPKLKPAFMDELRDCCARVLAMAGDSGLVFVGRSPESLFDYLSGAFAGTSWDDRCVLLNVSMRYETAEQVERESPEALRALHRQFRALRLSPADIAAGERPTAFVDFLCQGHTFGHLVGLLAHWAAREGVEFAAVRRRLRLVGITERTRNSPNTWRWYQRLPWAAAFPRSALRSVSVPYWFWTGLADDQHKVSRWHPPFAWGAEWAGTPPRDSWSIEALRFALALHERGRERAERERLAAALAARPEMRNAWLRRLVLELRRG